MAQSDEVGNGPCEASPELKVFQKEDGNQCCPNLGLAHWGGPDKRLYLEVLLDGLEEAFSLQRSLSMAAMVVNTKVRWTVRGVLHSFIPSFHTSIFRMGYGYFFFDR